MTKQTQAERTLELGMEYPYVGITQEALKGKDWAYKAAMGVLADLCDRGGIKHELGNVDDNVREDIADAMAGLIRLAHSKYGESP